MKKLLLLLIITIAFGCGKEYKPSLSEKEFTNLLIEMHILDGFLNNSSVYRGNKPDMKDDYAKYNNIFNKYGINYNEFDSCMLYYISERNKLEAMYNHIIDSLNRSITIYKKDLALLRIKDTIDLFPIQDTIFLDSCYSHLHIRIDSIEAGLYNFSTKMRFDSIDKGKNNRITSYFISKTKKDTIFLRDIKVSSDTIVRSYSWEHYIDSLYNRLEVIMVNSDNLCKLPKRKARIWNMSLHKKYVGPNYIKRVKDREKASFKHPEIR